MKYAMFGMVLLLVSGCATFTPYSDLGYKIDESKKANVGSVILYLEEGYRGMYNEITDGIRQELIYTGNDNNIIHLAYRELYSTAQSKYARPAFGLELKYDLSKNKFITFRDFKIQIDSADAERIIFTVLEAPVTLRSPSISKAIIEDPGPPKIYNEESRRYVQIITTSSSTDIDGYLIGEDKAAYYVSKSIKNVTSYQRVLKIKVRKIIDK